MLRFSRTQAEQEASSETDKASPASRLKAAMSRLGPSSSTPERTPSSSAAANAVTPSESDSDLNPVFSARKSLKDVFSRAMRGTQDSPDSKPTSLRREDEDDSQLSDSSLPMSSQAASLQLLRQRLELPEMSSRMDASRSTAKPSHSNQDLHRLLRTAEEQEASDISLDTARAASPPNESMNDVESPSSRPGRLSTPVRPPPTCDPEETDASLVIQPNNPKTPKPPGGWFTPSRRKDDSKTVNTPSNTTFSQTPAPPGAWKGTPMPQTRKSILKNTANGESGDMRGVSDSDDVESIPKAVTLVDSFGRERKFDENGDELVQPTAHNPSDIGSRRDGASVRLVDSMGNEFDPTSVAPYDISSDLGEVDNASLLARIDGKVTNLKQDLETAEARHETIRIRRTGKQASIPHERILQLAMDSRAARIERERLLRQNHLVRARKEERSAQLASLQARPLAVPKTIDTPPPLPQSSKGLVTFVLLLPLLLLVLLYFCARAYVRHYFLTSYYDPFFATVDPASLYRVPFLHLIQLPKRWGLFNVQHMGQALFGRLSRVGEVNRHVMTLISKPLADLNVKLPS